MSKGWVNFTTYKLEPNILLFRRCLGTDGLTGIVKQDLKNNLLAQISSNRKKLPSKFN